MWAGILTALWVVLAGDVGAAVAAPPPVALSVSENGSCTVGAGSLAALTDGDLTNTYQVTACPSGYYVLLDAGEGNVIAEVRILSAWDEACGVTLYVSEDGGAWYVWYSDTTPGAAPLVANRWTTYLTPPVRYVRLTDPPGQYHSCDHGDGLSYREVEAYGLEYLGVDLPLSEVNRYAEEFAGADLINSSIEVAIGLVVVGFVLAAIFRIRRVLVFGFGGGPAAAGGDGFRFRSPGDLD